MASELFSSKVDKLTTPPSAENEAQSDLLLNPTAPADIPRTIAVSSSKDTEDTSCGYISDADDTTKSEGSLAEANWIFSGISSIKHAGTMVRYIYSLALVVFSITVVMALIFTNQTKIAKSVSPWLAFVVLWFLILWLAMMEGGQGCLVGLQPVEKECYRDSHPIALRVTSLAYNDDNLDRFIVGRQFLVVLVVFVANMSGSPLPGANVLGLPNLVNEIFLTSGVAMSLTTIILGQLTAQVNAADCMLDFINNYIMLITTRLSLVVEWSGLLHSVYLVQTLFAVLQGKITDSQNQQRSLLQSALFWGRVVVSLGILVFSFTITLLALFKGKTTMYAGVPAGVSIALLIILMCFVGMMEGMQIALFSVVKMPRDSLDKHSMAAKSCRLIFSGDNLQAFLIGRQICVTLCMFVIARITTLDIGEDEENIVGVPDILQNFFNTGLLGAVITTQVASLGWRIVASSYPIAFLSNPLTYAIARLCLIIEISGICAAAWVLAKIQKWAVGYQQDEVYLGSQLSGSSENPDRRDIEA